MLKIYSLASHTRYKWSATVRDMTKHVLTKKLRILVNADEIIVTISFGYMK